MEVSLTVELKGRLIDDKLVDRKRCQNNSTSTPVFIALLENSNSPRGFEFRAKVPWYFLYSFQDFPPLVSTNEN